MDTSPSAPNHSSSAPNPPPPPFQSPADPPAAPAAIAPYLAAVQDVGAGRQRRRRQYGTYGDDLEEDVEGFEEPADEAHYRHLYDAHGVVDKWLGDPALWGMLSAAHFPRHAPPRSPLAARPRGALRRPRARLPTSPSPPPPPPSSPPLSPEAEKVGEVRAGMRGTEKERN
ncbi:unnamed protein product [Closterium sp. NIES-53]